MLDLSDYARKDDLNYFKGKDYIQQNYLLFELEYNYFKTFVDNNFTFVSSWESKGLSNEEIISTKITDTDLSPKLFYDNEGIHLGFGGGDYLKQDKAVYNHGSKINIFVVYKLNLSSSSDITLDNFLFGAVTLTKNIAGADKYKYSRYSIGFNSLLQVIHTKILVKM